MQAINRVFHVQRLTTLATSTPTRQFLLPAIPHRQILLPRVGTRGLSYIYHPLGIYQFSPKTTSHGDTNHALSLLSSKSGEPLSEVRGSLVLFLEEIFKQLGVGQEEEETEDEKNKRREEDGMPLVDPILNPTVRPRDKKPVDTPTDQPVANPVDNSDNDFIDDSPDGSLFPDFVEDLVDNVGDVEIF